MSDQLEKQAACKKAIIEARNKVLVEKDPAKAIEMLLELPNIYDISGNESFFGYSLATAYFENKNYAEAAKVYYDMEEKYQAGFCELLSGKPDIARKVWENLPENSATCWGKCLLELINAKTDNLPSFLQIRNHLESDIGHLIQAGQLQYAENLLSCAESLLYVHSEAYKFIGKALLYNNYPSIGESFLLQSKEVLPEDAEAFYCLGQYYYLIENFQEAKKVLKDAVKLNKYYVPAKKLLERINSDLRFKIA